MFLTYYLLGILIIPGILLGIYAQIKVSSTFKKFSEIPSRGGLTANQIARAVLDNADLADIEITHQSGNLTDHYHPKKRYIALSDSVYDSTSISAIGVALHEVGHAIQHKQHYAPLHIRNFLIPITNIASTMLWPLVIIGLLLGFGTETGGLFADICVWSGFIFFGIAVLLNLITLPVEFDASNRAIQILRDGSFLAEDELDGAKKVLNAAALTYVAALIIAILQFLRFLLTILASRN